MQPAASLLKSSLTTVVGGNSQSVDIALLLGHSLTLMDLRFHETPGQADTL